MALHKISLLYHHFKIHLSHNKKVLISGTISLLIYSLISWYSFVPAGIPLPVFGLLVSVIYLLIFWLFVNNSCHKNIPLILVFSVLFRIIAFYGNPIYEDDFYRYLWDGYRFAMDGTPYGLAPEAYFMDVQIPQHFQRILDGINHPDIPTIYAPTFQYLFLLSYWIAPGELSALKFLLIGFDCLLVFLLSRHVSAKYLILYAWNPLVIKEICFTAHPDGILGGLLLISYLLLNNKQQYWAAISLAVAAATKISAWPAIPFLLIRCRASAVLCFLFTLLALYFPFLIQQGNDLMGLLAFAQHFEFNSALYALINIVLADAWAKFLLAISYLMILAYYFYYFYRQKNTCPRIDIILGGLLLISPVINPWYLLWILPWACMVPSYTAWVASAVVLLSYITGLNLINSELSPYGHPIWLRPLEFGLIAVALLMDLYKARVSTQCI